MKNKSKILKKLDKKGVKYVVATSHANASERCQSWQGKIFELDAKVGDVTIGKTIQHGEPKPKGKIDGKNYYSLEEAMKKGFLGYNCRHRIIEYKTGMVMPKSYTENKINSERNIEKTARSLERQIRNAKKKSMLANTSDQRKKYQEESKKLQDTYWNYCKEHDYPVAEWRTRVSLNEREGIKNGGISSEINESMENEYSKEPLSDKNIVVKLPKGRYVFKFKSNFDWTKYYREKRQVSFSNHFTLIKDNKNVIHALDRHPEILEKVPNYLDVIKQAINNPKNVYINDNDEKHGINNMTLLIPLSKKEKYLQVGIVMSNVENRIKSFRYITLKERKLIDFLKKRKFKKIT